MIIWQGPVAPEYGVHVQQGILESRTFSHVLGLAMGALLQFAAGACAAELEGVDLLVGGYLHIVGLLPQSGLELHDPRMA